MTIKLTGVDLRTIIPRVFPIQSFFVLLGIRCVRLGFPQNRKG